MSEIRHEYVEGKVFAMAGASDDHNRIIGNIFSALHAALRGKRCEPFATDMKVRIPPAYANAYYYPDVIVVCDPGDNARYYRDHSCVIIELLLPDTERTDQREKLFAYRQIPSVEFYVLVEQERMAATVYRLAEVGWHSEIIEGPNGTLKLPHIEVEIPFSVIYERTTISGGTR